ncbi:hypothetical protein [Alkaliphilus sp. B6464]|uniref:hypothetical protein n=1 Tax=Alkaliphilus sp. B6464 TaxID=2731219 RepID=UPI001BA57881|nr:hypothetical protein [Alkaliphilus sp. B6464]QUH21842.1 hypothetical protein HYG84_18065 [Alkaliphilus sp. B6464]
MRDLIYGKVNLRLDNIKEIREAVDEFKTTQVILKRIPTDVDDRLITYIIGEKYIDLKIQEIESKSLEFTPRQLEDHIFRKIHEIGLYTLIHSAPELIATKIVNDYRDKIQRAVA